MNSDVLAGKFFKPVLDTDCVVPVLPVFKLKVQPFQSEVRLKTFPIVKVGIAKMNENSCEVVSECTRVEVVTGAWNEGAWMCNVKMWHGVPGASKFKTPAVRVL